ncbi:MFS transporter [Streptomyces inhibens]|uniref:ABC transporter MppL n=1 Tax=Streptomyces hygroscopicus TaxID=1912 RepID=Q643C4_STRHY|nr:MFS transporter [Streptomyces inhibens]AAU34205.1 ABC transporter MppL [Streptomyces hygroscopicus]UKY51819.1 MFS transporter [Streptomyces inhibens]
MTTAPTDAETARGSAAVPLSRNRDYNILWSSQLMSELAMEMAAVAVPLLILARHGSPLQLGLASSAMAAAHMISVVPAGVIADRWDRRRLMLGCQVLRVLGMVSLAGALLLDRYAFWHVLLVVVLEGFLGSVFDPAEHAALPQVVPPDQLSTAVARNAARPYIATLVGPGVAGFLFSALPLGPFATNAVMFALSSVALCFLRLPRGRSAVVRTGDGPDSAGADHDRPDHDGRDDANDDTAPRPGGAAQDFAAGFRWVLGQPVIRTTMAWMMITNLVFSSLLIVLLALSGEDKVGAGELGLTMACFGAGGLLGGLFAARMHAAARPPVILLGFTWTAALGAALMAVVPTGLPQGALLGLMALFAPLANTTVLTYQLTVTPDELRGRMSGVAGFCSGGAGVLGPALGGALTGAAGGGVTPVLICAGCLVLVAVAATASPTLRRFPDIADRQP